MSGWSRPSPVDLQTITPAKWTVEASVKPAKLGADYQTFVVRDGTESATSRPETRPVCHVHHAPEALRNHFCDVDRRNHAATCAALTVEENHWYHVAATSDGETLKLYVDSLDGNGYRLRPITACPDRLDGAGSRRLADQGPGTYAVIPLSGRWAAAATMAWPRVSGLIDEVRICDVGLEPGDFLFAKRRRRAMIHRSQLPRQGSLSIATRRVSDVPSLTRRVTTRIFRAVAIPRKRVFRYQNCLSKTLSEIASDVSLKAFVPRSTRRFAGPQPGRS